MAQRPRQTNQEATKSAMTAKISHASQVAKVKVGSGNDG
jgi:hypothetical protein